MSKYDKTFDPKVLIGQCELISRFSDFALYLPSRHLTSVRRQILVIFWSRRHITNFQRLSDVIS